MQVGFEEAETLIFVDADGVVNVGVRDTVGQSPLLLCEANLARCRACPPVTTVAAATGSAVAAATHIMSAAAARDIGHGDEGTYAKFATQPGSCDISPLFAQRLADIIRCAGPRVVMVLSSSWRKATHQARVSALEDALTQHCGRSISFESRTKPGGDEPEKRIELIGDFVHDYSATRQQPEVPLRVVVLDDFGASHPKNWKIKQCVSSTDAVEEHLRARSTQPHQTTVKLVHTYDEWRTELGLPVRIGTGLTTAKVCEAQCYLQGRSCPECAELNQQFAARASTTG